MKLFVGLVCDGWSLGEEIHGIERAKKRRAPNKDGRQRKKELQASFFPPLAIGSRYSTFSLVIHNRELLGTSFRAAKDRLHYG